MTSKMYLKEVCQNWHVATYFHIFGPNLRSIDRVRGGGGGGKYTFLERSLHWEPKKCQNQSHVSYKRKLFRQKPKI